MSWQAGLYVAAVFLPLVAFLIQFLGLRPLGRLNAYIATGAIGLAFVLSLIGFVDYVYTVGSDFFVHHPVRQYGPETLAPAEHAPAAAEAGHGAEAAAHHGPFAWKASADWVTIGGGSRGADGKALPGLSIPLAVHIDNLAVIMFLMVTLIATLIHVYSMGYMHDDPRYPLFFCYLSLFCFSMLGLVASANVFMVFLFWELVGVCSYLLIGFWHEDKKNSDAANKAFIVNRVGDVGMLMGLGLLWTSFGTFNINEINTSIRGADGNLNVVQVGESDDGRDYVQLKDRESGAVLNSPATGLSRRIAYGALIVAGLGVFAGCVGKSAQFPLHVWLPDAMAGPTPVSALIHAATMVAAGVYLVGRFYPVFTEEVLLVIAYTGGITLFIAATIAVVQTDYKKVLAYSTVSQLGFMMLGLGVGGWAAGLFHLLTHAFFKALLFLGAGSVYHSVHTYEMPVLGGLRKKMPVTALTMLIATLAISGVPFFSGFYSKDAILAASLFRVFKVPGGGVHVLLFILPALGATVTAFYMFRMWFLVFAGEARGFPKTGPGPHLGNPVDHAHESGPLMLWPLIVLAVPTVFVGWTWQLGLPIDEPVLERLLTYGEPVIGNDLASMHWLAVASSFVIAAAGIGGGIAYYAPPLPYTFRRRFQPSAAVERFRPVYDFLLHKWYFDELYDAVFVRPTLALARGLAHFDRLVVDGLVNGSAALTSLLSRLEGVFDSIAVDGLVTLVAKGVYATGDKGRLLQTGRLRNYLMVLAVAFVGLSAGVFAWVRGWV